MHHLAIMNKKAGHIDSIVKGVKRIESRWYVNRVSPYGRITKGDTVYFKNSGEEVTAKAEVEKVIQIEGLDKVKFREIVEKYADLIQLKTRTYSEYYKNKRYVILIFLKNPKYLKKPFQTDKTGYGISTAWITVQNINEIKY